MAYNTNSQISNEIQRPPKRYVLGAMIGERERQTETETETERLYEEVFGKEWDFVDPGVHKARHWCE